MKSPQLSAYRPGDLVRLGVAWALVVASVTTLFAIALSPAWER
jgi:hypothetical protein